MSYQEKFTRKELISAFERNLALVASLTSDQITKVEGWIADIDPSLVAPARDAANRVVSCFGVDPPNQEPLLGLLAWQLEQGNLAIDMHSGYVIAFGDDEHLVMDQTDMRLLQLAVALGEAAHQKLSKGKRQIHVNQESLRQGTLAAQKLAAHVYITRLLDEGDPIDVLPALGNFFDYIRTMSEPIPGE